MSLQQGLNYLIKLGDHIKALLACDGLKILFLHIAFSKLTHFLISLIKLVFGWIFVLIFLIIYKDFYNV